MTNALIIQQNTAEFCFNCSSKEDVACYDEQLPERSSIEVCNTSDQCQSFNYEGHFYRGCYSKDNSHLCHSDTDSPCDHCSTDLCNSFSYKACYNCVDCWKLDPNENTMVCDSDHCGIFMENSTVRRTCVSNTEIKALCPPGQANCMMSCNDSLCNNQDIFACFACDSSLGADMDCYEQQTNTENHKICNGSSPEYVCGTIIKGTHIIRDCLSYNKYNELCSKDDTNCRICPDNLCNSEEAFRCFYCEGIHNPCSHPPTPGSDFHICRDTKTCLSVVKSKNYIVRDCMNEPHYEKHCKDTLNENIHCQTCHTSFCNNEMKQFKYNIQLRGDSARTFEFISLILFIMGSVLLYVK